jgi:hypothetical protein
MGKELRRKKKEDLWPNLYKSKTKIDLAVLRNY